MVTAAPTLPEVGVKLLISGVTAVLIRPMELLPPLANHSAPSGPAAIPIGSSLR
jgi:hypothetical protein